MPATTVTVDTFADVVNSNDGLTSLREAITQANGGTGDYVVNLPAGTYAVTRNGPWEDDNGTGDFDVKMAGRRITFQGVGAGATVIDVNSTGAFDRVFHVHSGDPTFTGLTIKDGYLAAYWFWGTRSDALGAGVHVAAGSNAVFQDVVFNHNWAVATDGEAGYREQVAGGTVFHEPTPGYSARGGGLYYGGGGTLTLLRCTFQDGVIFGGDGGTGWAGPFSAADLHGGDGGPGGDSQGAGVYIAGGTVTMTDVRIAHNSTHAGEGGTGGAGGAVSGSLRAGVGGTGGPRGRSQGGGLYVAAGTVTATNLTLDNNGATFLGEGGTGGAGGDNFTANGRDGPGGDGHAGGPSEGGGLYLAGGTVTVTGLSAGSNYAWGGDGGDGGVGAPGGDGGTGGPGRGGAVFVAGGTLAVSNYHLTFNAAYGGEGGAGGDAALGHVENRMSPVAGAGGAGGAGQGGALYMAGGTAVFTTGDFNSNFAWGGEGGVGGKGGWGHVPVTAIIVATRGGPGGDGGDGFGGALYLAGGQLTLNSPDRATPIRNNSAGGGHGGTGGEHPDNWPATGLGFGGDGGDGGTSRAGAVYYQGGTFLLAGVDIKGSVSAGPPGPGGDGNVDNGDGRPGKAGTKPLYPDTFPANLGAGIGNLVWRDDDQDGIQDPGEPGVANVPVRLFDGAGNLIGDAVTTATGTYAFHTSTTGPAYVQVTPPAGWEFTRPDRGGDSLDSDFDPATGKSPTITRRPGLNNVTVDAGLVAVVASMSVARSSTAGAMGAATLDFNTVVTGVDRADFSLTRDGSPVDLTGVPLTSADGKRYALNLAGVTGQAGSYVLTLNAAGSGIRDAAGHAPLADVVRTWSTAPFPTSFIHNANQVLGYSSQAGDTSRSAAQALGSANTFSYGDSTAAWTPASQNGTSEYLEVGFATLLYADGVTVRETWGNGFVTQIDVVDTADVLHTVWTGTDPSQPGSPVEFRVNWERTDYLVKGVRIHVNTDHNPATGEAIDSVRLHGLPVNTPPVLDPAAILPFPAFVPTTPLPAGVTVGSLLGPAVTDPDVQPRAGAAVFGTGDPAQGTWEFSADAGASWYPVGPVAPTAARLLERDYRIRFVPAAGFTGSATLAVRAWDQMTGIGGGLADLTAADATGPTSAFSTAAGTVAVAVAAKTLPPVAEDNVKPPPIPVSSLPAPAFLNANPTARKGVAVTHLTGTADGTWQYSTDAGRTWQPMGAASDSAARLLRAADKVRFLPNPDFNGPATVGFHAWDGTGGAPGSTADLTATGTGTGTPFGTAAQVSLLTVTPVNDRPVLDTGGNPTLPDVPENSTSPSSVSVSSLLGSAVTDVDAGAVKGLAVVGTTGKGTWQFSTDGGQTWANVGSASAGNALLLRPTDRLRFVPARDFTGPATISFKAWDQTTGKAGGRAGTGGTAFSTAVETATVTVIDS